MRKTLLYIFFCAITLVTSCSFTDNFSGSNKEKLLLEIISYLIEKEHYSPRKLDDAFSEEVFNAYIKQLDPYKRLFTKADIRKIGKYKTEIDDQIKVSSTEFFDAVYELYLQRYEESKVIYKKLLAGSYNFEKKEYASTNYDSLPFVSSKAQIKERWRKQLKMLTLSSLYYRLKDQDSTKSKEPYAALEKKAIKSTAENMSLFEENMDEQDRKEWFSVYINSILTEFDPHTFYFDAERRDRFDTDISGKFEGIGAVLQKKNNLVTISQVISGGPAWKQKALEAGDVILKVAQDENQEPVLIGDMRLRDAIKLIKGPKGSNVYLTVKRVSGKIEVVTVTRDLVEIEETYLKTAITETPVGKLALMRLPKFYIDFEDYDKQNAASDMKKEIEHLNKENVKGIVLDLRNNGGGSLKTVVDIMGLFIPEGPVVQINASHQKKKVLNDTDSRTQWDKSLVILVNEFSASASEILAAAVQDYNRGIIIGSKQTYGKGTVQNLVDLNRLIKNNNFGDLGALKLTFQKFYRVSGGSTQLEGVKSDIVIPDRLRYLEVGEKDQESALPWDKISPADYKTFHNDSNFKYAIDRSNKRISLSNTFKLIDERAKLIKEENDNYLVPLRLDSFENKIHKNDMENKKFDILKNYNNHMIFKSLEYKSKLIENDSIEKGKADNWHRDLTKDPYVEEAFNILIDINSYGNELASKDSNETP